MTITGHSMMISRYRIRDENCIFLPFPPPVPPQIPAAPSNSTPRWRPVLRWPNTAGTTLHGGMEHTGPYSSWRNTKCLGIFHLYFQCLNFHMRYTQWLSKIEMRYPSEFTVCMRCSQLVLTMNMRSSPWLKIHMRYQLLLKTRYPKSFFFVLIQPVWF